MRTWATVLGLVLLLGGCGGGGGGTSGPAIDVSGTYRVNGFSNTIGGFTATVTLQQNGGAVTGTYQNNRGATFRVDGTAVDVWIAGQDSPLINTHHHIDLGGGWSDLQPYVSQTVLGSNAYTLRVDRGTGGTSADFVLSVGPASGVPEPATLVLAGLALVPVGLRAVRRRKQ